MATTENTVIAAGERADSLAARFDPRANGLMVMRLVLASVVAVHHAGAIAYGVEYGLGPAPVEGMARIGDLAVDAFFVLSGFLVTMSYIRLDSLPRYLWHRCLRIFPAFWVCLLLTATVVAPVISMLEGATATGVFPEAFGYVRDNVALHIGAYSVAGLPHGTHSPGVVNGALWTLFYEFICYVAVAVLGVAGMLRRRRWALVALAGVWMAQVVAMLGVIDVPAPLLRRFLLVFLLGVCAYLYREQLRINGIGAGIAAVVFLGAALTMTDYRVLGGAAFAYLLLWAAVALPLRWNPRTDLSYGIYIWHWPIEVILVLAGVAAWGFVPLAVLGVGLAGCAAAVSWHFVEKPALEAKGHRPPWVR